MSRVQLAEKPGGAPGEGDGIQAEELAALGYIYGPELSGPLVHVLEDVPMNRLEMRNVESSRQGSIDQLCNAPVRLAGFKARQKFRVSEIAQVPEDVCAGIYLRVQIPGRRAHRSRSLLWPASTVQRCIAGTTPWRARRDQTLPVEWKQSPLRRRACVGPARLP